MEINLRVIRFLILLSAITLLPSFALANSNGQKDKEDIEIAIDKTMAEFAYFIEVALPIIYKTEDTDSMDFVKTFLEEEKSLILRDQSTPMFTIYAISLSLASGGDDDHLYILEDSVKETMLDVLSGAAKDQSYQTKTEEEKLKTVGKLFRKHFISNFEKSVHETLENKSSQNRRFSPWTERYASFCKTHPVDKENLSAGDSSDRIVLMFLSAHMCFSVVIPCCTTTLEVLNTNNFPERERLAEVVDMQLNVIVPKEIDKLEKVLSSDSPSPRPTNTSESLNSRSDSFEEGYKLGQKDGYEQLKKEGFNPYFTGIDDIAQLWYGTQYGALQQANASDRIAVDRYKKRRVWLREKRDNYIKEGYGSSFVEGYIKGFCKGQTDCMFQNQLGHVFPIQPDDKLDEKSPVDIDSEGYMIFNGERSRAPTSNPIEDLDFSLPDSIFYPNTPITIPPAMPLF